MILVKKPGWPVMAQSVLLSMEKIAGKADDFPGSLEFMVSAIRKNFPDLDLSHPAMMLEGCGNVLIRFGRRYVFKIPRYQSKIPDLRREIAILKAIGQEQLPVPEYYCSRFGKGFAMAGFSYIDGTPISGFKTLSETLKTDLKSALRKIHALQVKGGQNKASTGKKESPWADHYSNQFKRMLARNSGLLDPELLDSIAGDFKYFRQSLLSGYSPSFIHGDFYRNNILVSADGSRLEGILDWGDAFMGGDPAIDIAAIAMDYGEQVLDYFTDGYGQFDAGFTERAKFYIRVEPIFMLDQGRLIGDEKAIGTSLETLAYNFSRARFRPRS